MALRWVVQSAALCCSPGDSELNLLEGVSIGEDSDEACNRCGGDCGGARMQRVDNCR